MTTITIHNCRWTGHAIDYDRHVFTATKDVTVTRIDFRDGAGALMAYAAEYWANPGDQFIGRLPWFGLNWPIFAGPALTELWKFREIPEPDEEMVRALLRPLRCVVLPAGLEAGA